MRTCGMTHRAFSCPLLGGQSGAHGGRQVLRQLPPQLLQPRQLRHRGVGLTSSQRWWSLLRAVCVRCAGSCRRERRKPRDSSRNVHCGWQRRHWAHVQHLQGPPQRRRRRLRDGVGRHGVRPAKRRGVRWQCARPWPCNSRGGGVTCPATRCGWLRRRGTPPCWRTLS